MINKTHFSERLYFETHYETVLLGGDNIEKSSALRALFPGLFSDDDVLLIQAVDDSSSYIQPGITWLAGFDFWKPNPSLRSQTVCFSFLRITSNRTCLLKL